MSNVILSIFTNKRTGKVLEVCPGDISDIATVIAATDAVVADVIEAYFPPLPATTILDGFAVAGAECRMDLKLIHSPEFGFQYLPLVINGEEVKL